MLSGEVDHQPDVRLAWVLGAVVVLAAFAPVALAVLVGDRLPTEVPRHYGADGRATATWSLTTSLAFTTTMTLLTAGGCAALAVLLRMPVAIRRAVAWTVTWVAVLLGGLKLAALWQLMDVADPMAGGSIAPSAAVVVLLGMVLGVPVAALAREDPHGHAAGGPPPPDLPRLGADAERTWRSGPLTSRALATVLAVLGLLFVVPAILIGPFDEGLWLLVLGFATLLPAFATARLRVIIDVDGLHVRSGPIRLLHVPAVEVARAEVVDHLDPFWEFGGWGLRVDVHGRTGIVSRAGEALRLVRGDDTEVLVTVDDARGAAATLNTIADDLHGTSTD